MSATEVRDKLSLCAKVTVKGLIRGPTEATRVRASWGVTYGEEERTLVVVLP
jgi:hypothetical protein